MMRTVDLMAVLVLSVACQRPEQYVVGITVPSGDVAWVQAAVGVVMDDSESLTADAAEIISEDMRRRGVKVQGGDTTSLEFQIGSAPLDYHQDYCQRQGYAKALTVRVYEGRWGRASSVIEPVTPRSKY